MRRSFLQSAMLKSIAFCRSAISPNKGGPTCNFVTTCSQYAKTAIERYGAGRGGRMAAGRLLRCSPWAKGGYDPVPEDPRITMKKE